MSRTSRYCQTINQGVARPVGQLFLGVACIERGREPGDLWCGKTPSGPYVVWLACQGGIRKILHRVQ